MTNKLATMDYIPFAPVIDVDQIKTSEQLINALTQLSYEYKDEGAESIDVHECTIAERKERLIKNLFNVTLANAYVCVDEFTVFVTSLNEVQRVKFQAKQMGFINIQYREELGIKYRINNSLTYAVVISNKTNTTIGEEAHQLRTKLHTFIPELFAEIDQSVIYTFSNFEKLELFFENKDIADVVENTLSKIFDEMHKESTKFDRKVEIKLKKTVRLDVSILQLEMII